jgi:hypothetical protein
MYTLQPRLALFWAGYFFEHGGIMKSVALLFTLLSASAAIPARADVVTLWPNWGVFSTEKVLMPGSGGFFPDSFIPYPGPPIPGLLASVVITGYWDNTDQYKIYDNGALVTTTGPILPLAPPIDYGDTFGTFTTPDAAFPSSLAFCPSPGCISALFSGAAINVRFGDVITIQDVGPLFYDAAASAAAGSPQYDAQVGIALEGLVSVQPEPSYYMILIAAVAALIVYRRRARAAPSE